MRTRCSRIRSLPLLVLCASVASAGCGGEEAAPAPVKQTALRGTVVDAFSGAPLASVALCLDGTDRCVGTADDGSFLLLGVPERAPVIFSLRATGYAPTLVMGLGLHRLGSFTFRLVPAAPLESAVTRRLGVPLDGKRGALSFDVYRWHLFGDVPIQPIPAVLAEMEPLSGDGPLYLDALEPIAGTQGFPGARNQTGFYVNLDPGRVDVRLATPEPAWCDNQPFAWPGLRENMMRADLRAGWLTYVFAICL